ncbi:NAD(P)-dependent oxidoreductase [Streptomyces sp. NPDC001984]|uniref:NAD(P)-dependent oxidoreductase n=1 Tax=Streptomyces sp. NPDC002619 TaxID=3364655 RepID=UPI0036C86437
MPTVGFIGLGQIGQPMAQRIVDDGHDVVLFDVRPACLESFTEQGVRVAASVAEIGDCADVVLVSLPDPRAVTEVAIGQNGLAYGRRVKTYVDLSTTGPVVAREVATALAQRGIDALDAPVSGGANGARSGTLTVMASGARHVFEQTRPIIQSFGRNVFYVGAEVGLGQAMKLANNLLAAGALALTAEAMAIGVREGLDARTMIDVFNAGTGMNTATRDKFPKAVLTGSYNYGFRAALMNKDLKLELARADELQVPLKVGRAVNELFESTVAAFPDADFTFVARQLEQWAGVTFQASSPEAIP